MFEKRPIILSFIILFSAHFSGLSVCLAQNSESQLWALEPKAVYDAQARTTTISWKPATGFYSEIAVEIHGRPYSISEQFQLPRTFYQSLEVGTYSHTISNLPLGVPTIYEIRRAVYRSSSSDFWSLQRSHLVLGFELPWREHRGAALLVIEEGLLITLAPEIDVLKRDLLSDGFSSVRIVGQARMAIAPELTGDSAGLARRAEIDSVRAKIKSWYLENTTQNRHVILIGRIPVAYSGTSLGMDGHQEHSGAWSVPLYYSDMDETYTTPSGVQPIWTDEGSSFILPATMARNHNRPGDGKLDPDRALTAFEMRVGRIDFANLGAAGELQRYRQYLQRNHDYRFLAGNYANLQLQSAVRDNHANISGAIPCASGWDGAASLFNKSGQVLPWFSVPVTSPIYYIMACSNAHLQGMPGVVTSAEALANPTAIPFTFLFGSFFADWDTTNNLMVAILSGPANNLVLATAPAFLPNINLSLLAIGESIGAAGVQRVERGYAELLGDPTLRVQRIFPPRSVSAVIELGNVRISWNPSAGASTQGSLLGYHVFRAAAPDGPYVRLTGVPVSAAAPSGAPIAGNSFVHTGGAASANGNTRYYVVAIAKINTGSSSYYDSSQGALTAIAGTSSVPASPRNLHVQ